MTITDATTRPPLTLPDTVTPPAGSILAAPGWCRVIIVDHVGPYYRGTYGELVRTDWPTVVADGCVLLREGYGR